MRERVYPQFQLWDERSARATMRELVAYLAPSTRIDLDAVPFPAAELRPAMPMVVPSLSPLPVLIWKADVGCQAWRNAARIVGNDVIVSSSGRHWNQPDDRDGVVCLYAETGKPRWFAAAPTDVNCTLVSKGVVVAGCDDGTLFAVRLVDGERQWTLQLGSAVVGGPLKLRSNIGSGMATRMSYPPKSEKLDPVAVVTGDGRVVVVDLTSGRLINELRLGGEVAAEPYLIDWDVVKQKIQRQSDGRLGLWYFDEVLDIEASSIW